MTPALQRHPYRAPMPPRGGFEPVGLRANRLFESRDLDEARDRISRVMQPHEVRRVGKAAKGSGAHMDFVRVGGIGLGTIDFGEAVQLEVDAIDDYHLLMFCLRGHAETRVDGRALDATMHQGIICAPGRDFSAALSPDCEQFVVRLDRAVVDAHAGGDVRFVEQLDLHRPALQAWLEQLRAMAASPHLLAAAQRSPVVAAELERLSVMLLLEGQSFRVDAPASRHDGSMRTTAPGCVRKAEQFIDAHFAQALRLDDIARAAEVPVRSLLDAFKRFRSYSPMHFLKETRLDAARRRLLGADRAETVSAVALDCGFAHFGRFSQAYRSKFGELPAATMKRRSEVLALAVRRLQAS